VQFYKSFRGLVTEGLILYLKQTERRKKKEMLFSFYQLYSELLYLGLKKKKD